MPGKVKVKVIAGKNLPVMDRSNDTTDAYVEVKLGNVTFKTDVCRKSLNPQWNSEWFRFEMDDLELQDEPLQIRLMDHDTYSANDSIGKVYIDLNPLLTNPSKTKEPSGRSMSGWIPVYDTMHGIRGEVNLMVKVELFSDLNKFRQSSCGVKFFFSSNIPEGHQAIQLHGFVEELVVNDDPEYQWIDKIRTPRASNEARQTLFSKLSGEVQRRVGLKALELGGNAVIGYKQCFDLEGESGIVVRGIGTAATLTKSYDNQLSPIPDKECLDGHLHPGLIPRPPPSPANHRPIYSKSTSLVAESSFSTTSSRLTTNASMPEPVLRRLHSNMTPKDFRDKSLAEVIFRLSNSTNPCMFTDEEDPVQPSPPLPRLTATHHNLTPQTSCDSSILTFRRGSLLESDEDRMTDPELGDPLNDPNLSNYKPNRLSKKKDKYSTTGLIKRANITIMSLPPGGGGGTRSSEKLKEEFIRFFKRRQSVQAKEFKSKKDNSRHYRKPRLRRDFFSLGARISTLGKIRQGKSTDLQRSTSESNSLDRQSLESLSSLRSTEDYRFEHEWSGTMNYPSLPSSTSNPRIFDIDTLVPSSSAYGAGALVNQTSSIMEAFKGLRYERPTDQPLRLYISSIDALLVCNPNSPSDSLATAVNAVAPNTTCYCRSNDMSLLVGVNSCDCMSAAVALVETNRGVTKSSPSANNELTFVNAVPSPGDLLTISGSSASGGGSKEEIQMHDEATTTSQVTTILLPSTVSVSEPIPEEQCTSSNDNSLAENKSTIAKNPELLPNYSNPPHLIHDTKSSATNGGRPGTRGQTNTLKDQSHSGSINNMNQPIAPRTLSSVSPIKVFGSNNPNGIGTNGRRSSESDLSTPPKGILNSSIQAMLAGGHGKGPTFAPSRRPAASSDHFDMLEYPFITIYDLPPKFIQRIGGSVSARSVKLLERISNLEEPESRDLWWTEIRMEIRSHARSICCNVILGYEEHTTICDDVCILSATGTAAVVNSTVLGDSSEGSSKFNLAPLLDGKLEREQRVSSFRTSEQNGVSRTLSFSGASGRHGSGDEPNCYVCHIPYNETGAPFSIKMARCGVCKKARVPDLMLATINIPSGVPVTGKSCLIQAQVFRQKKDCKGESSAKEVSDSLPFLEYELHRRLINKLKVKGMNAIFCLNVQICLGENLIMATATGTALCLTGLPTPDLPKITAGNMKTDTQKVCQFQKVVQDAFDRNREFYKVIPPPNLSGQTNGDTDSSENESEEDLPLMNLATGNKDTYVLEVDDSEDIEIISELIDPSPPVGFDMSNLERVLGYDDYTISKQQMFIHVWRCRIPSLTLRQLSAHFDRILRSISFKLRSMRPCILNKIRLRLELPEADEMQVCVTGTALGLKEKTKTLVTESRNGSTTVLPTSSSHSPMLNAKGPVTDDNSDMIFTMESDVKPSGESLGESNQSTMPRTPLAASTSNPVTAITVSSPSSPSLSLSRTTTDPEQHSTTPTPQQQTCSNLRGSLPKLSGVSPLSNQSIPLVARYSASPMLTKLSSHPPQPLLGLIPMSSPMAFPVCSIPPLARSRSSISNKLKFQAGVKARGIIEITTLSHIPGQRIEKYLGNLNFFFIRETTSIKEMGGPTGFVHSFVMEVTAILRGHVSALGGNALVSYFMTELSLLYNPHKNQGQCLISVGGDAVLSLPPNPISTTQDE